MLPIEALAALRVAEKKFQVRLDDNLFELIIEKTRDKYPRLSFVEARRYALNECKVWDKEKRRGYNSAAGMFFGAHGGRIAAKGCSVVAAKKKLPPSKRALIEEEKTGQFRFVV